MVTSAHAAAWSHQRMPRRGHISACRGVAATCADVTDPTPRPPLPPTRPAREACENSARHWPIRPSISASTGALSANAMCDHAMPSSSYSACIAATTAAQNRTETPIETESQHVKTRRYTTHVVKLCRATGPRQPANYP